MAALCISVVRAVAVNLGMYGHFSLAFGGSLAIPDSVWALTLFVLPFSFAIAVLKDVPDREGDRQFRIATFTVRLGPRRAFRLGLAALVLAYAGMAMLGPLLVDDADGFVLAFGHALALALLLVWARRADPADPAAFTRFYMRVWALFFLEYALVPAAVLARSQRQLRLGGAARFPAAPVVRVDFCAIVPKSRHVSTLPRYSRQTRHGRPAPPTSSPPYPAGVDVRRRH